MTPINTPNTLHFNPDADLGFLVETSIIGAEVDEFLNDVNIIGRGKTLAGYAQKMVEEPLAGIIYLGLGKDKDNFGYTLSKGPSMIPINVQLDSSDDSFRCLMSVRIDSLKGYGEDIKRMIDSAAIYAADIFTNFIGGVHHMPPGDIFKHNLAQSFRQVITKNSSTETGQEKKEKELIFFCVSNSERTYLAAYNPESAADLSDDESMPADLFSLYSYNHSIPEKAKSFAFKRKADKESADPALLETSISSYMVKKLHHRIVESDIYGSNEMHKEASVTLSYWIEEFDIAMDAFSQSFNKETIRSLESLRKDISGLRNTYASVALFKTAGVREEVLEFQKQQLEDRIMEMPSALHTAYSSLGVESGNSCHDNKVLFEYLRNWEKDRPALPEGIGFAQYTD